MSFPPNNRLIVIECPKQKAALDSQIVRDLADRKWERSAPRALILLAESVGITIPTPTRLSALDTHSRAEIREFRHQIRKLAQAHLRTS